MTLLGLDFDNTLVRYDRLFHQLALEKGLIEEPFPADKVIIRDYLRSQDKDHLFTLLQGEVYGLRLLEAAPADGMLTALGKLKQLGMSMVLVSHKTRRPYKGPAFDLHQAAWNWLEKYGFFEIDGFAWSRDQVFFEESKSTKIARIKALGCTHYVDDLPEILGMLPNTINSILYDPSGCHDHYQGRRFGDWEAFVDLILCE